MDIRPLLVTAVVLTAVLGTALTLSAADTATVHTPSHTLTVAVADTPEERRTGLMDRVSIPYDGMLFVFPEAAPRTFWMKDTHIPLDIVFIGQDGKVLNVAAAAPVQEKPDAGLTRYRSDGPAKYVLEVRQGDARQLGLEPGAEVRVTGQ
ncbi:MAG: DUF192 domain-containing protein [Candidatus Nanohaloarchaea archaeon]|nr:DUF192 domain-containing protein [Candidatus Nanohaloarchaea archaeon]